MASASGSTALKRGALLGARERQFASLIWQHGQLSRRELNELTAVHPTLTGNAVSILMQAGLVREATLAPPAKRGRPQIPVEIDPDRASFLGLAISPGMVRVARLDPTGKPRGQEQQKRVSRSADLIEVARVMLQSQLDASVHSIGVSFTGLMDAASRRILFSSSQPSGSSLSLQPIYDASVGRQVILNNDLNALALRWLLASNAPAGDVLLVGIGDGRLAASMLVQGRPQRGSISAANELGHMRLDVATDRCYCGMRGCLERIISTPQLRRAGSRTARTLEQVLADPGRDRTAIGQLLSYLVIGLSNAVNFVRPEKLVISSPLVRHAFLRGFIEKHLPAMILPGLRQRVQTIFWEQPNVQSAENAGWLALADVFGHSPRDGRQSTGSISIESRLRPPPSF